MSPSAQGGMRFAVDGWDPAYGTSLEMEDDLGESTADVVTDIETSNSQWAAIPPDPTMQQPGPIVFVDGVRRLEARIWIDEVAGTQPASEASAALCASYAAGTVCCCPGSGAHLLTAEVRRGLFTVAPHAVDVVTTAGTYGANGTGAMFQDDEYFSGPGIVTVVPEPAAAAMLVGSFGALLGFRRRR